MAMERRTTDQANARVRIEDRAEGQSPRIVGYAAVYYDGTERTEYKIFDDLVERIMPGAFDRALSEKHDARALFNHQPDNVLGRVSAGTVRLESDSVGLKYIIEPGDTTIAKDVMEHIRRGDVQGSSFRFHATGQAWKTLNGVDFREVTDVDLGDVGPVTYPAYEATTADLRSSACEGASEARDGWRKQMDHDAQARRGRALKMKRMLTEIPT